MIYKGETFVGNNDNNNRPFQQNELEQNNNLTENNNNNNIDTDIKLKTTNHFQKEDKITIKTFKKTEKASTMILPYLSNKVKLNRFSVYDDNKQKRNCPQIDEKVYKSLLRDKELLIYQFTSPKQNQTNNKESQSNFPAFSPDSSKKNPNGYANLKKFTVNNNNNNNQNEQENFSSTFRMSNSNFRGKILSNHTKISLKKIKEKCDYSVRNSSVNKSCELRNSSRNPNKELNTTSNINKKLTHYNNNLNNNNLEISKIEEDDKDSHNNEMRKSKYIKPIPKEIPKDKQKKFLHSYCVLNGNNGQLILRVMRTRPDWELSYSQKYSSLFWSPVSQQISFNSDDNYSIQFVNHLENHHLLSNKMNLFANLMKYCENKNIDLFSFFPMTIVFNLQHQTFYPMLENFCHYFDLLPILFENNFTIPKAYKLINEPYLEETGKKLEKPLEIKKEAYLTYDTFFKVYGYKGLGSKQLLNLPDTMYKGKNLWIIKPIHLNRGRNIKVLYGLSDIVNELRTNYQSRNHKKINLKESLNSIKEIKEGNKIRIPKNQLQKNLGGILNNNNTNNNNNNIDPKRSKSIGQPFNTSKIDYVLSSFVILQKYIESPLLYNGRKFDIRIWVMFKDNGEVYVFKEGHLKATCDKFDLDSHDPFIHLTNYSVQKHNDNFSKVEIGNEISFDEFQVDLSHMPGQLDFKKTILPKIWNIIKVTANCVRNKMVYFMKKRAFEIFGYDFIIDTQYNPFLLEINTNPGLEESSPLIRMLLPRLIDDAFRLTIDEEYARDPEEDKYSKVSPFKVKGYEDDENMWKKLISK